MKQFANLICAVGFVVSSYAQNISLNITTEKTTSLVFPFSIRHVDRGSKNILVQQLKEVDNILLVKAGAQNFPETNLSVVTADDSIYTFTVSYQTNPSVFVYELHSKSTPTIPSDANSILNKPPTIRGVKNSKWHMHSKLIGIYIRGATIYYQLRIDNQSPIDYDVDFFKFFIRDKKQAKRTAMQQNEVKPLYVAGNYSAVKAKGHSIIVVALAKFTIPDAKYLAIEIREKNGGRNLLMKVNNHKIIKATRLSDLK